MRGPDRPSFGRVRVRRSRDHGALPVETSRSTMGCRNARAGEPPPFGTQRPWRFRRAGTIVSVESNRSGRRLPRPYPTHGQDAHATCRRRPQGLRPCTPWFLFSLRLSFLLRFSSPLPSLHRCARPSLAVPFPSLPACCFRGRNCVLSGSRGNTSRPTGSQSRARRHASRSLRRSNRRP